MTQTSTDEFVLWGFKGEGSAFPEPIKLCAGPRSWCNAGKRMRKNEGWTFGIYKQGTAPVGLRLQAEAAG